MPRFSPAVLLFALAIPALAAEPDSSLALHKAIADARALLDVRKSAEAVELLEKHVATADGNKAFLDVLRAAYAAEALRADTSDPKHAADLRTKLALLGGPPAEVPAAVPTAAAPASPDVLRQAATLFNEARAEPRKYGPAAKLFAAAFLGRVEMTQEQLAAWAYCRVRLAAEDLNRGGADPSAVIAEVDEALRLAPSNAGLQKFVGEVTAAARHRGGKAQAAFPTPSPVATAPGAGDGVETASFRVRGTRAAAEVIARAAEAKRDEIFARWSGPPGAAWSPKCEIVLHASADSFAQATRQPAAATGFAVVRLDAGRVVERRIDLRADDDTAAENALPRELTHVVLADLFRDQPPPKWAEIGMAALATSPAEVHRVRTTLSRCYANGELYPLDAMLDLKSPPAERLTGFYVGSVSLVDFLVKWKGDKAFTTFLRDSQRYGLPSAMKRQYGVTDAKQLEAVWSRSELTVSRGQGQ